MNSYEQKQAEKKERLAERAEKWRAKAEAEYKKSDMSEEATGIPFGQPIIIGSSGERRHRRTIERANAAMGRSIEASKKADELERRANTTSNAISSDDPDAVKKLKKKLAGMVDAQEKMKAANKLIRKGDDAGLVELLGEKNAEEVKKPDFCGRVGFASYSLSNNNANIKRVKQRITQLEASKKAQTAEPVKGDGWEITENAEDNRIWITFEGKPEADVRKIVKSYGFKWSPTRVAWVRMINANGRYAAEQVAKKLNEEKG